MNRWKTKSRSSIVRDKWISLYADECVLPNGNVIAPYYVLDENEWVHVVAVDSNGDILLTQQYRYAANVTCSELPCGAAERGEEPLSAAKRELKEETGYVAEEWTELSVLYANPARQTNRIYCFIARKLAIDGPQTLDSSEEISFQFVSSTEVMRRIFEGDFTQALHVASFLLAVEFLKKEPNKSTDPTLTSGTPLTGPESRHS